MPSDHAKPRAGRGRRLPAQERTDSKVGGKKRPALPVAEERGGTILSVQRGNWGIGCLMRQEWATFDGIKALLKKGRAGLRQEW